MNKVGWLFRKGQTSSRNPIDSLIQDLRATNAEVCSQAADQAGEQRLKAAVPALVELLYCKNKRVIAAAARALGEIGDLRAMQHLGEASYAQEFAGGAPGFETFAATGEVVEVAEDDILRDKALREAHQKLWQQPGAQSYFAQLGDIKMYTFGDFWRSGEILIDPAIQHQPQYPFTMDCAKRFFKHFAKERFAFEGEVKSICVSRGKEALPRHSVADGFLLSQTLDEMAQVTDPGEERKYTVGEVHFEFGGNAVVPYLTVSPEPKWPRPSIVRRCVLDGGTGIRFEELS
jgi:hypothetical protein